MPDKAQINLRVSTDQKEKWENYVEEEGKFASLTGLIRASVESEIAGDNGESGTTTEPITSDISELSDALDDVRKDVAWIRRQHQDDVDISDLAQDVFDHLEVLPSPRGEVEVPADADMSHQEYVQYQAAQQVIQPDHGEEGRNPQSVSALAEEMGVKENRVEDAIIHLQEQFLPVVEVEVGDETHYFKDD